MKKLLTNILFVTVLSAGLKPQPIEATIFRKLAFGVATIGAVFGIKSRATVSRVVRNGFNKGKAMVFYQKKGLLQAQDRFEKLHKFVFFRCKADSVNQNNAESIFEKNRDVKKCISPEDCWNWKWHRKEFIEDFVNYCGDKYKTAMKNREIDLLRDYGKIIDMTTSYLGCLDNPYVSRRDIAFTGFGVVINEALHRVTSLHTKLDGLIDRYGGIELWSSIF